MPNDDLLWLVHSTKINGFLDHQTYQNPSKSLKHVSTMGFDASMLCVRRKLTTTNSRNLFVYIWRIRFGFDSNGSQVKNFESCGNPEFLRMENEKNSDDPKTRIYCVPCNTSFNLNSMTTAIQHFWGAKHNGVQYKYRGKTAIFLPDCSRFGIGEIIEHFTQVAPIKNVVFFKRDRSIIQANPTTQIKAMKIYFQTQ